MDAFLTGVLAGYGIAIPVGAIAVLIVDVGIRCGFRCAFSAGAGAATADFLYAGLAVSGGAVLASRIASVETLLQIASAIVLVIIAVHGLRRVGRCAEAAAVPLPSPKELARTYARFVGLTIINPTTIVYFAAVIIGLGVASGMTRQQGILFVTGAFLASLSWQTLLAAIGALAGSRLPPQAQSAAIVAGNLVIIAFAVVILIA